MLKRTPLKRKTLLQAKTPWRWKPKPKAKEEPMDGVTAPKKKRVSREPNYVADMDKVFQYWVRLRDAMPGGYCRCISCSKMKSFEHIQAGHYMSRRHMSIRWNPLNVNAECEGCNGHDGDHLIGYRENLIKKIGEGKVKWLEAERWHSKQWSDFEIKMMIKYYSKQVLQLSASKHIPISKGVLDIIKRYEKLSRTNRFSV